MSEPKTFASLGPTLLARKGGARPAMRPQLAPLTGMGGQAAQALAPDPEELEDLGWNDMGDDEDVRPNALHEAQVYSLTPSPANPEAAAEMRAVDSEARAEMTASAQEPEVRRQQRQAAAAVAPVSVTPVASKEREPVRRKASDASRRAAFTLRLDAKRHLKLRLASTVKNRSAQQLVTAALDKFLADIPEIEAIAAQVKRD